MDLILTPLLVLIPSVGLAAPLIRLRVRAVRRTRRQSETRPADCDRRGPAPLDPGRPAGTGALGTGQAPADRPAAPAARALRLTSVLAVPGEILVGYRTCDARTASERSWMGDSSVATETLLLFPIDEDTGAVVPTLQYWASAGVEVALYTFAHSDVVILCDRRTSDRLWLSHVRAPRD
jgi:hypothetical protein